MKVGIITVSDSCFRGEREDKSGSYLKEKVRERGWKVVAYKVVPDEKNDIVKTLTDFCEKNMDVIFTTGGTGLGKRDITPEVTEEIVEKKIPGISEIMRVETFKKSKYSVLSRGVSGIKDKTLIINLPGSLNGTKECFEVIIDIIEHSVEVIKGIEKHEEKEKD